MRERRSFNVSIVHRIGGPAEPARRDRPPPVSYSDQDGRAYVLATPGAARGLLGEIEEPLFDVQR